MTDVRFILIGNGFEICFIRANEYDRLEMFEIFLLLFYCFEIKIC